MSFHSHIPKLPAEPSASDARTQCVRCDLPARLDVLPGEVDLIEMWLGNLIADLSGGDGGGAAVTSRQNNRK